MKRLTWLAACFTILVGTSLFLVTSGEHEHPEPEGRRVHPIVGMTEPQPPRPSEAAGTAEPIDGAPLPLSEVEERVDRLVEVLDSKTGDPVPRATLYTEGIGGLLAYQGETDGGGRITVSVAAETTQWIYASAPAHAPGGTALATSADAGDEEPTRLLLEPAMSLRGRVVWADGTAAGQAEVLAWPYGRIPSLTDLRSPRGASLWMLRTRSDTDGSFQLNGADPSTAYLITAVGDGGLSTGTRVEAPFEEDLLVRLQSAFGAVVRPDTKGAPLPTAGLREYGPTFDVPRGSRYIAPDRVELALLGIPESLLGAPRRDARLVVMTSDETGDSIGPLLYTADIPGYEHVWTEFMLPRLSAGTVAEVLVPMEPLQDQAWGKLDVVLGGLADEASAWRIPPGTAHLRLTRREGDVSETFSIDVLDLTQPVIHLDPIPRGSYRIMFRAAHGLYTRGILTEDRNPAIEIADEGQVRLRLADSGAVEAVVTTDGGLAYRGAAKFRIESEGDQPITVVFDEAPYRVPFLPERDYGITMTWPAESSRFVVPVEAGQVTQARFEVQGIR